jgi:hypothetical protein
MFDEIRVQVHLQKSDTNMRAAPNPRDMLAITMNTTPGENVLEDRESQIPQVTDVNCASVWLCSIQGHTKL